MKILANDGISAKGIELLTQAGFDVITTKVAQQQVANFIEKNQIQVLLVRSATKIIKDIIASCPSLKLIGRAGVGTDNIDVKFAAEKGISVINTPNASSLSVAELVFAHLFSGARFLHDANRNMPLEGDLNFNALKKAYAQGVELRGKTIGIVGFGRIGQQVAKIAIGIGMKVLAFDSIIKKQNIKLEFFDDQVLNFEIQTVSFDEVISKADFITLHVPTVDRYLIDEDQFAKMKKNVGIINTARGGVINEVALIKAIDEDIVAFAGLDVFEDEPTPAVQVLMNTQISLTPHIGASTLEAQERIGVELAQQIIAFFKK